MNIIERAWQWLFTKHQKESTVEDTAATTTTDSTNTTTADTTPVPETTTAVEATSTVTTTTVATNDDVLDELKDVLIKLGHDIEDDWEFMVGLAKNRVTKS